MFCNPDTHSDRGCIQKIRSNLHADMNPQCVIELSNSYENPADGEEERECKAGTYGVNGDHPHACGCYIERGILRGV